MLCLHYFGKMRVSKYYCHFLFGILYLLLKPWLSEMETGKQAALGLVIPQGQNTAWALIDSWRRLCDKAFRNAGNRECRLLEESSWGFVLFCSLIACFLPPRADINTAEIWPRYLVLIHWVILKSSLISK